MPFALPPKNIDGLSYAGPNLYITPCVPFPRRPTTSDTNYPVMTFGVNMDRDPVLPDAEGDLWYLARFDNSGANLEARWVKIASGAFPGGPILTMMGDDAVLIYPDINGNVTLTGSVVANSTESKAVYVDSTTNGEIIKVQVGAAIASTNITKVGLLAPSSADFNVDANGFLTLKNQPVMSITVEGSTPPGTNPVLPDSGGDIEISCATVASGTIGANVLRTYSVDPSSFEIQIQIAGSDTASNTALNGACHFDSNFFDVDVQGFVEPTPATAQPTSDFDDAGVCSFYDQHFTVDADGFVDATPATAAATSDFDNAGICSFESDHFTVDADGFVDASPAAAAATSDLANAGICSFESDHFTVDADGFVDASPAAAAATSDLANAGIASFDNTQFTVDANGFVQIQGDITGGTVSNLGISYSGGTFTVNSYDGSALSASNPGIVWLQDKTTPGRLRRYLVTANQTFTDGAAGTTDNQRFGLTTGVNWSSDIPFFLYAVTNDSLDTINFMISRNPSATSSPVAASIGKTGAVVNVDQSDFFSLGDVTVADYESNPCLCIGSFKMTFTGATDSWTVTALTVSDGIGQFNEQTYFTLPAGVNGSAAGTYFQSNAGTEPQFTTNQWRYKINRSGRVFCDFALTNCNVAGVGAQLIELTLPYVALSGSGSWAYTANLIQATFHYTISSAIGGGAIAMNGFVGYASATLYTNAGFGGGEDFHGHFWYTAY